MRAFILGCGPAGLLAAEACHSLGLELDIFSIKRKSPILGAQFLHQPIPNITGDPDGHVTFAKVGTKAGYASKVYGHQEAPVSWEQYQEGVFPAWSLRTAYDLLWAKFSDRIHDLVINQEVLSALEDRQPDVLISAVPVKALCRNRDHLFTEKKIWVEQFAIGAIPENTIVYNGRYEDAWYRTSNLWGFRSTEYPHPRVGGTFGVKPLHTTCDCRPKWKRVGRFGKWDKSVLTHHAYQMSIEIAKGWRV